jgi:hypothetical protein
MIALPQAYSSGSICELSLEELDLVAAAVIGAVSQKGSW